MTVTAVRTPLIQPGADVIDIVARSLGPLAERTVVVVASKIVSIGEGRLVDGAGDREVLYGLARRESERYIDPHSSRYGIMLTIKGNWMFVNAGIDESNSCGRYSLWPVEPQASADQLWHELRRRCRISELGVIIADSGGIPLNWGVVGRGIAHCGFVALRSYVGSPDLFGRTMQMERTNLVQSLAAAAVLEMGEGVEQTPVATCEQIGSISFQDRPPSAAELAALRIALEDDAYAPVLQSAPWRPGGQRA